jgi:hypothetical protein
VWPGVHVHPKGLKPWAYTYCCTLHFPLAEPWEPALLPLLEAAGLLQAQVTVLQLHGQPGPSVLVVVVMTTKVHSRLGYAVKEIT